MSYRIEYAHRTFRVDGSEFPDAQDRYIVLAEGGDSNCYGFDNKRSWSWGAIAIGRLEEVLEDGCLLAASCESEGLRLKGRTLRPEGYLRVLREQMRNAQPTSSAMQRLGLYCRTEMDDETDVLLRSLPGAGRTNERDWNKSPLSSTTSQRTASRISACSSRSTPRSGVTITPGILSTAATSDVPSHALPGRGLF